jgi:hypothetical protein
MHHIAIKRIVTQNIGHNFAKSIGKQSFVNAPDCLVHIFFGGRNTPAYVSLIAIHNARKSNIFFAKANSKRLKAKG